MSKKYEDMTNDELLKAKEDTENSISAYDNLQMAMKVGILNSGYGSFLNQYFLWFDNRIGESITLSGQLVIKWSEKTLNQFFNKVLKTKDKDYVVAIDTDSCIVTFGPLVDAAVPKDATQEQIIDFIDRVCKERIEPLLDSSYADLGKYTNAFEQKMNMKREAIADSGIHLARKKYIMNVLDNEGVRYTEPELKMMGIEAIRSSTPEACRDSIKETIRLIMQSTEEETQKYIQEFKEKFMSLSFEDIAFPRGVNGLSKYKGTGDRIYEAKTPIHVRGSLLYNQELKNRNLQNKYQMIQEGDKIKFCYLKTPNSIKENVISVYDVLPREFGLDKYIDYEKQYEKAYLEPIRSILKMIDWDEEERNRIDDFF